VAETLSATPLGRPGVAELTERLGDQLAALCTPRARQVVLAPLPYTPRDDAPTALRVSDAHGRPVAAMLCSAPQAPGMVARAMRRAADARALLGEQDARHILEPLLQGRVRGLSYAVLPWCESLSAFRPLWALQRAALRPALLDWLLRLTQRTVREPVPDEREARFAAPLQHLAGSSAVGARARAAARQALQRLARGEWRARTVLMHGDLWKGNLLLRPRRSVLDAHRWADRFVVIDWPGAEVHGHAFYDLVRLSRSLGLRPDALRHEIARHCAALGCSPDDALASLLAALGQIGMALEHFPPARYAAMVDECVDTLAAALARGR